MTRYAIAFLAGLMLTCTSGHAHNLLIERAYFHDPHASYDAKDLAALPFAAFSGPLNLGITTGTTWIRLTIEPGTDGDVDPSEALTLRVGPSPLVTVRMQQAALGSPLPVEAFSRLRRCPDHLHCASLKGLDAGPLLVYLQVEGRGYRLISVDVLGEDDLMHTVMAQAAGIHASLTVAIGLFLLSIFLLLMDRTALTLAYLAFQGVVLAVMVGVSGISWPAWINEDLLTANVYFLYPLRTAMTILLLFFLVRAYQPSRLLRAAVLVLLVACALNLLLMAIGEFRVALTSNFLVYVLNPLIHLVAVIMAVRMRPSLRLTMISGGLIFLGLISYFSALGGSGIQHFGDWRLNGMYVSLFIFVCVMMERSHLAALKRRQLEQMRQEIASGHQLDAQLRDRQSLIDMLTHELKNPLATIRFALSSLREMAGGDSHMLKRLNNIGGSAARMDRLLDHVASVSRIEMAQVPSTTRPIPAVEVVGEVLAQLELARAVETDIQGGTCFSGDPLMIRTILENLLKNADAYGLPQPATRLRIGAEAGHTVIEVSNAVATDALPDETRMFERYYRHSSALRLPGIGIGLSLVRTCVEKLGGTIDYLQSGQHVSFLVRLPN